MTSQLSFFRRPLAWLALLAGLMFAACGPSDGRDGVAKATSDSASVMVDSVNYMHERSVQYTLYDLSQSPPRAIGGSIVARLARGGDKGCCISLAKTWKPGAMVRLTWAESDRERTYEEHSQELQIPRYESPADLYVVFYPGPKHEVELVVSAGEPGHPDWRGKIKETPWEQCVATYTRKPCFAALPKQFDTGSRGYCFRADRDKRNDFVDNCAFLMHQCLVDFEDEPFCKDLLWDSRKQ